MSLSEELTWRGFVYQTTLDDLKDLDTNKYKFYLGVDPSADSLTVGNLAPILLVRHFAKHSHEAVLLVGGATGQIGDPDGKAVERELVSKEEIASNKAKIAAQFKSLMRGAKFTLVDNLDWFKDYKYLDFLRDVGKHVPMRAMLGREFVDQRLGEGGNGISYAEFSYVLIQAYDFLRMHRDIKVNLQLCASDQWGNSVAGVDLIRRVTGDRTDVLAMPLIVNPLTGVKFGKTESGAVWLDPEKTTPSTFFQFWVNAEDSAAENYLKIYTELSRAEIEEVMNEQKRNPSGRPAQFKLADEVTKLVHGEDAANLARSVSEYLTSRKSLEHASRTEIEALANEIPHVKVRNGDSLIETLVRSGLASSNGSARQLLNEGAVYINNERPTGTEIETAHLINGRALLRRGKAYKDSALLTT